MAYISAAQAKQIAQKAVDNLKDGTLVPKLTDNLTPYAEDSGTTQTQPFFLEGTATGNGESRVDAKQVPAFAFLQKKRGNMVTVNQLVKNVDYFGTSVDVDYNFDGYTRRLSLSGTASGAFSRSTPLASIKGLVIGHKYAFLAFGLKTHSLFLNYNGTSNYAEMNSDQSAMIVTASDGVSENAFIGVNASSGQLVSVDCIITVSDLTQWFGSTDNIPAELLSHPETFGRYYKGYLTYEPGRLEPATGRYLTSVGRNIWNEEWELGSFDASGNPIASNNNIRTKNNIPVIPGETYYFRKTSGNYSNGFKVYYLDPDGNVISVEGMYGNNTFKIPANCYAMKWFTYSTVTTYDHDITISEYYTGESGYGQHYPHEVLTVVDTGSEDLGAFDVKYPSGLIERNSGEIADLTTETWHTDGGIKYTQISDLKSSGHNLKASKYVYYKYNEIGGLSNLPVGGFTRANNYIYVNDSSTPSGSLQYELAAPTTEQGTPFQENIPIDDFGQLSWSDTDVPQGNQIFYPVDYKAFDDTLIKHTDGNATSLVRKTDYASANEAGVMKIDSSRGITISSDGRGSINPSDAGGIKSGISSYLPITPYYQHQSVFYGLAKAAGANLAFSTAETAPNGTNTGVYPAAAKAAIQDLLGITDLIGDINTVLDSVNGVVI